MGFNALIEKIKALFHKRVYNPDWKCLNCGAEIFDNERFCKECLDKLPFNNGYICDHCGRKVVAPEGYCSTCKGVLTSLDKCRSVFNYEKPISTLIMRFKYGNHRYIAEYFAEQLSFIYFKNWFNADFFVYAPMSKKAQRNRGYNQAEILAQLVSKRTNVPVNQCIEKVKETKRQATLKRADRLKNLVDAFKVTDRKLVKDKTVVIIDDVTTTGATAEAIAQKLKKAGAKFVYLISVASTPPIEKY